MARDSFILYTAMVEPALMLSNEQLGRLFRALYAFQAGEEDEVDDDIWMPYKYITNQMAIDARKYEEMVEKRTRASRSRASYQQKQDAEAAKNITRYQMISSDIYNVNDNVNVNENENVNVNVNDDDDVDVNDAHARETTTTTTTTNNTLYDYLFILFFRNIIAAEAEAKRFVAFYEGNGWRLQGGDELDAGQRLAKASLWTPKKEGERFSALFLDAWRVIVSSLPAELRPAALSDRTREVRNADGSLTIVCRRAIAEWMQNEGRTAATEALRPISGRGIKINLLAI